MSASTMRLAFIADGRVEHTRRWLRYFAERGDDVLLLSSHPCPPLPGVALRVLPGLFQPGDAFVKSSQAPAVAPTRRFNPAAWVIRSGLDRKLQPLWSQIKTVDVLPQGLAARRALRRFQPDLVHAMRIQNEGYIAAVAGVHPWMLSTWGQDFILFARRYPLHGRLAGWVVRRPDALTADCQRDIDLAHRYGLPRNRPAAFFPGNGGVDLARYAPGLPGDAREALIIYPRGIGPYVRPDTLLAAFHLLRHDADFSQTRLLLLAPPAAVPRLVALAETVFGALPPNLDVQPYLGQAELAALLQRAAVMVSPSVSDGTPNTLLEAMACGALPVMGRLDSIAEWITDGRNGLFFDVDNPHELAAALRRGLHDAALRTAAQAINRQLIEQRADYARVMPAVRAFYAGLIAAAR